MQLSFSRQWGAISNSHWDQQQSFYTFSFFTSLTASSSLTISWCQRPLSQRTEAFTSARLWLPISSGLLYISKRPFSIHTVTWTRHSYSVTPLTIPCAFSPSVEEPLLAHWSVLFLQCCLLSSPRLFLPMVSEHIKVALISKSFLPQGACKPRLHSQPQSRKQQQQTHLFIPSPQFPSIRCEVQVGLKQALQATHLSN